MLFRLGVAPGRGSDKPEQDLGVSEPWVDLDGFQRGCARLFKLVPLEMLEGLGKPRSGIAGRVSWRLDEKTTDQWTHPRNHLQPSTALASQNLTRSASDLTGSPARPRPG